jgi:hypothetical protein
MRERRRWLPFGEIRPVHRLPGSRLAAEKIQ